MKDKYNLLRYVDIEKLEEKQKKSLLYIQQMLETPIVTNVSTMAKSLFENFYKNEGIFKTKDLSTDVVMKRCYEIAFEAKQAEMKLDIENDPRTKEITQQLVERFLVLYKEQHGHNFGCLPDFQHNRGENELNKLLAKINNEPDDGGSLLN